MGYLRLCHQILESLTGEETVLLEGVPSSADYGKVLRALRANQPFSVKAIKNNCKKEGIPDSKLSEIARYLYSILLDRLVEGSIRRSNHLTKYLAELEFLHSKNLFSHFSKVIPKARAIASKEERFEEQLKLLEYELLAASVGQSIGERSKVLSRVLVEKERILNRQNQLLSIGKLYVKGLKAVESRDTQRKEEYAKALESFQEKPGSFSARILLNSCRITKHYLDSDWKQGITVCDSTLDIYKENPSLAPRFFEQYVNSILLAISLRVQLGEIKEAQKVFNEVQDTALTPYTLTPRVKYQLAISFLYHYLNVKQRVQLEDYCDYFLSQGNDLLSLENAYRIRLFFALAWAKLALGEPEKGIELIDVILDKRLTRTSPEYAFFGYMIHSLCLIDLGKWELAEIQIKANAKRLRRSQLDSKLFSKVLYALHQSCDCFGESDFRAQLNDHWKRLLIQFPELKSSVFKFDFPSWIEAKISGKPIIPN